MLSNNRDHMYIFKNKTRRNYCIILEISIFDNYLLEISQDCHHLDFREKRCYNSVLKLESQSDMASNNTREERNKGRNDQPEFWWNQLEQGS